MTVVPWKCHLCGNEFDTLTGGLCNICNEPTCLACFGHNIPKKMRSIKHFQNKTCISCTGFMERCEKMEFHGGTTCGSRRNFAAPESAAMLKKETVIIRNAAYADCKALSAFSIYVWLDTYAKEGIDDKVSKFVLNEFTPEKYKQIINAPNKKIVLAENDNLLIGIVAIDQDSNYRGLADYGHEIRTLYVHPNFQGKGVGKKLLCSLKDEYGPFYWLTTWIHNESAICFYQAHGFRIIGKAEYTILDEVHENHVLSNR